MSSTRTKLLDAAMRTLATHGIAKVSARTVAAEAGVNQGLIFYHFGSVDDMLAEACRYAARQRVDRWRPRLEAVGSMAGLLEVARELHTEERAAGHVALLGQLLAGAQGRPGLAEATSAGLDMWIEVIEPVLTRLLAATPLAGAADPGGLARAVAASFVGLELYEGADPAGAASAFAALEQLAMVIAAVESLGPVAQYAVRRTVRRHPSPNPGSGGGT